MKVFYCCFAGAHASVVAASIHCNLLPDNRVPLSIELDTLNYYDRTDAKLIGTPYWVGNDEFGNEVYCMGLWSDRKTALRGIHEYLHVMGIPPEEYLFIDVFHLIPFSTKIGGLLSKRFGIVSIGRRLTILGIQAKYFHFINMVKRVKQTCQQCYKKKGF